MDKPDIQFVILALQKGDKKAFETIYLEFYSLLLHLCNSYTNDQVVSEELVQDTFLKLWEIRQSINAELNIRNYLYTITKNNCLNYLRNQKISLKYQENLRYREIQFNYDALNKLGDFLQFEELRTKIDQAISNLPEDVKETFILSRVEELPYKEIAEKQGVSIKTVEARISKSLRILRKDLQEYLPLICLISSALNYFK